MPPISPMKDGATGKIVKSATLTPLRTLELNEVYQLITANKRLITLTQAIREAALQGEPYPTSPPAAYSPDDGATA